MAMPAPTPMSVSATQTPLTDSSWANWLSGQHARVGQPFEMVALGAAGAPKTVNGRKAIELFMSSVSPSSAPGAPNELTGGVGSIGGRGCSATLSTKTV